MAKLTKNERITKLLNIQKVLYGCIDRTKLEPGDDIYAALFETKCNLYWLTNEIDALYFHERGYNEELQRDVNRTNIEEIKERLKSLRNDALGYDEEITDILNLVNELEV